MPHPSGTSGQTAVITGSTKGVGRGLADAFVRRGHNVYLSSRNGRDIERVSQELTDLGPGAADGQVCDAGNQAENQALWDAAVTRFGHVDYWINNAGLAVAGFEVHELPEEKASAMVSTNIRGAIFGSQVAIQGFRNQGHGRLYNMLGGSFNAKFLAPKMGVYSATKGAIYTLTRYLVAENDNPNIVIATISPGQLITENWLHNQSEMSPEDWAKFKPIMEILCDHVDTATPWLVDQILANRKSGRRIAWSNNFKLLGRFISARVFRRKRDLFSRYGL